ncbi:MAG: type II toxin-antitoxin system RelB/DinJ family antitoxin [bacterium]
MIRTASVHVRLDETLKDDATAVVERLGLSLSSAITLFLSQVALRKEIPFALSVPKEFNRETVAALEDGEAIAKGKIKAKRYKTVNALFDDL